MATLPFPLSLSFRLTLTVFLYVCLSYFRCFSSHTKSAYLPVEGAGRGGKLLPGAWTRVAPARRRKVATMLYANWAQKHFLAPTHSSVLWQCHDTVQQNWGFQITEVCSGIQAENLLKFTERNKSKNVKMIRPFVEITQICILYTSYFILKQFEQLKNHVRSTSTKI